MVTLRVNRPFFKRNWRTLVLFCWGGGTLIPLFWTSGDICPGFQSQCGFYNLCNRFLRFTSGATPADLLAASMVTEPFRSTYLHYSHWLGLESIIQVAAASQSSFFVIKQS